MKAHAVDPGGMIEIDVIPEVVDMLIDLYFLDECDADDPGKIGEAIIALLKRPDLWPNKREPR
jgi:hypothetical protein